MRRLIPGTALVHEHKAEFFYVLDGSGVVTLREKLRDEVHANAVPLHRRGLHCRLQPSPRCLHRA